MWGVVAERFADRGEVLGYELLNEPFMGDFYRDPLIAVPHPNPRNADAKRLQPAYDRLNAKIRSHDDDTLVFFAGVTWDDAGPGFSAPPGGEEYADRSVRPTLTQP
jgi:endoglycosylceramidase